MQEDGIQPGLIVLSASGGRIGLVKEVEEGRFQVDRRLMPDLWLRRSAVSNIRGNTLVLKAHTYELDQYDASDDEGDTGDAPHRY